MNMKKIAILALSLCMVAAIATTGTIAYFTDTDNAINTMTMGNVQIEMTEKDIDGSEFAQKQTLLPVPSSVQKGEVNEDGISLMENYIPKIVDVENTGNQDAYVRVVFAFPAAFDDAESASNMIVHWNMSRYEVGDFWTRVDNQAKVNIDNVEYNLYTYTYLKTLAPEETTEWPALAGLYMDQNVDATYDDKGTEDKSDDTITYTRTDLENKKATVAADYEFKLYAFAQGVQADGFESAADALNAAFGEISADNNPWKN